MNPLKWIGAAWTIGLLSAALPALAQEAEHHDVSDLAKQTQNPVSDLISIPFQFNFNSGGDLEDRTFLNLNVQPVMPFSMGEKWKVIARTIVPVNTFPGPEGSASAALEIFRSSSTSLPRRRGRSSGASAPYSRFRPPRRLRSTPAAGPRGRSGAYGPDA
jgi:hypothetical protein